MKAVALKAAALVAAGIDGAVLVWGDRLGAFLGISARQLGGMMLVPMLAFVLFLFYSRTGHAIAEEAQNKRQAFEDRLAEEDREIAERRQLSAGNKE